MDFGLHPKTPPSGLRSHSPGAWPSASSPLGEWPSLQGSLPFLRFCSQCLGMQIRPSSPLGTTLQYCPSFGAPCAAEEALLG